MNEPAPVTSARPRFDSSRMLELEAEVRGGANHLIFLSSLTVFCGLFLSPLLVAQGAAYLLLAIVLRVKQSRAAAAGLLVAAFTAALWCVLAFITRSSELPLVGFAMPEVALLVAAWTAFKAFRFQRLLAAPLVPVQGQPRGV